MRRSIFDDYTESSTNTMLPSEMEEREPRTRKGKIVNAHFVASRIAPDPNSKLMEVLYEGEIVEILDTSDDGTYYKVKRDFSPRYVSTKYCEVLEDE